jgi:hypothetical protein
MATTTEPLSLPPQALFDSYDALLQSIQQHAKSAGYAFTTSKSERRKGKRLIYMGCKRAGKERATVSEEDRRRRRQTVKCGCQFSVKIRELANGLWSLTHRKPEFSIHNHNPASPGAFPEHRQLKDQQIQLIETHYAAQIPASRTVAILQQQTPDINIYHRDIYNITAALSRAKRAGKSPPEALISRLETEKAEGKLYFEWRRDQQGHIAMVFLADMRSVEYLNQHPDILLLDCTYKTNKFDMPLLDILGVDNHDKSFSIGFCFLGSGIEDNYKEAIKHLCALFRPGIWPSVIATDCEAALINAVNSYFPAIRTKRVLCYWHISKCVLANCVKWGQHY